MKVYVVKVGNYSNRFLFAAYSTRELAEAALNRLIARIREREETGDGMFEFLSIHDGERLLGIYDVNGETRDRIEEYELDSGPNV